MPLSENERLGCYAMLRSLWNTGSDYLAPFERMLVTVLRQHAGNNISIETATKELYSIWRIDVPRMPMLHLFSRLSNKKIVEKRHNDKRYIIHKENIRSSDAVNEKDVSAMADRFESIVNECCSFCLNQTPSIPATIDQIRQELTAFLSQQSIDLAIHANSISGGLSASSSFYRVGLYINHLNTNDRGKLKFLNEIAVGHILCKCLSLDGVQVQSLNDVTIYLDADIIFILLGIDTLERTDDYRRLITDLRNLGASLRVFQHNIEEVNLGLDSAIAWINSPDYDPVLASKAARYFTEKNASIAEIEFVQSTLIQTLESQFGISIETASYDASYNAFNHDEKELQRIINKKYIETANGHPHDADSRSIQRDATSVNQIYRNRCGASSPNLSECKCVLITTNVTFAKAIKDYEKAAGMSENSIAACISDALVGTLVWLYQPTRIEEESYARLNALARASFIPSEAEIAEFTKQVEEAHKRGSISDAECYFLRTAQVSREMLKKISAGMASKITENTPEDILKMILAEGKAKAREEIAEEYAEKLETQSALDNAEIKKHKIARLDELRELRREKAERMQDFEGQISKYKKSLKRTRILFAAFIAIVSIFAIVMFCKKEWFWGVVGGIPVIGTLGYIVASLIADKKLDLHYSFEKMLSTLQKKKTAQLTLCNDQVTDLNSVIAEIDKKIEQLESDLTNNLS